MGILCASIPSLKALFSKTQRQRTQNTAAYQYHSRERSGAKSWGKGSSGNGSTGTVIQNENIDLKAMENGEQQPRKDSQGTTNGNPAWLASDSEAEDQRILQPHSRL